MKFGSSPLFVWKLVLLAVITGAVFLTRIDPVQLYVAHRRNALPKALEINMTASPDIVFFGDSLLQATLAGDDLSATMKRVLARKGYREPLRVVDLAQDGRSTWDIEQRGDEILSLQPKILVLQVEMLIRRGEIQKFQRSDLALRLERLQKWALFTRMGLQVPVVTPPPTVIKKNQELVSSLAPQANVDIGMLHSNDDTESTKKMLMRAENLWSGQPISKENKSYQACAAFVKKAQAKGIRVLIVATPVSVTAERLATREYMDMREQVARELLSGASKYIRFPTTLPDNCFHDYSHVNDAGRKEFLRWFAKVLAAEMIGAS